MYLDGPLSVGLFEPEPQEPRDRDRHEERLDEGGVVYELVHVVGGEHGERDEALRVVIQRCHEFHVSDKDFTTWELLAA